MVIAASGIAGTLPARAQRVGPADTVPPSIEYGPFYAAVALAGIFSDSKTFPDLLPNESPAAVVADYDAQKSTPGFSLAAFVASHFSATPIPSGPSVQTRHREPACSTTSTACGRC